MAFVKKRAGIYVSILFAAFILLVLAVLTFHAGIRHATLSIIQGLYETQRQYSMRRFLAEPDFGVIVKRLESQLDIVQALGSGKSQLSLEFIETMAKVMVNARSRQDYRHLKPLLERLAVLEPRAYLPQLWLAKALLETGESGAADQIERAIALMPADDRAHRLALQLAVRQDDEPRIGRICARWAKAQQGGITIPDHFGLFDGQSLRRLAIQVIGSDGNMMISANAGLELGTRRRYEFRFDGEFAVDEFTLWLAVFPGTRLRLRNIEFLDRKAWHAVGLEHVIMLPSHGYFDRENAIVLDHRGNQNVTFVLKGPRTGSSPKRNGIVGIALDATFDKLSLTRASGCK